MCVFVSMQGVVRGFLTRRRIAESRAVEELNLVVKQYAIRYAGMLCAVHIPAHSPSCNHQTLCMESSNHSTHRLVCGGGRERSESVF